MTADGPLRVVNTHLEYHSTEQRRAQVMRLRDFEQQMLGQCRQPPLEGTGPYRAIPQAVQGLICGDFNMEVGSTEYDLMLAPLADEGPAIADAWRIAHGERAHDPTCGVFDHVQWPQGRHCRDFFFAVGAAADAVRSVWVNTDTDASDHQPLVLELAETSTR